MTALPRCRTCGNTVERRARPYDTCDCCSAVEDSLPAYLARGGENARAFVRKALGAEQPAEEREFTFVSMARTGPEEVEVVGPAEVAGFVIAEDD